MERQRGVRQVELLSDEPRGKAFRPLLDEQAKDVEARFLRETSQGGEGILLFHGRAVLGVRCRVDSMFPVNTKRRGVSSAGFAVAYGCCGASGAFNSPSTVGMSSLTVG